MRRLALALAMLLALDASGANEFAVVVPSGATGVYGVIVNPANQAQGYDITTDDGSTYLTLDRTDADQQISFGSAIAMGASDERQFASLPSGLSAGQEHTMLVFDASDELLATVSYVPQYDTIATPDVNVATLDAAAVTSIEDGVWDAVKNDHVVAGSMGEGLIEIELDTDELQSDDTPAALTALAGQVTTVDGVVDSILVDSDELQANQGNWLTATGFATSAALATAQSDLDAITGADGVTLATLQSNYAPVVVGDLAGLSTFDGSWQAAWDAEVQSEVADALSVYDAPTKAELDAGLGSLNDLTAADVLAQASAALIAYDMPTRAEATADTNSVLTVLGTPVGDDLADDIANSGGSGGITEAELARYIALIVRKDPAVASDLSAELDLINQDFGSGAGAYAPATHSLEKQSTNKNLIINTGEE